MRMTSHLKTLGAGIDKIDDRGYKNEKTYKFQIQPADTLNLEARVQYLYDIQVAVGNVVKTVLRGVFVLGNTISGTTVTTQELDVAIDDELETELATTPATNGVEYEQDPVALAKIGDLKTLETDNQETVVKAINEVNTHADTNAEEIYKIKNGTLQVPNAKNSLYCQYASEDTSKGTIEERLTNLGFKQGVAEITGVTVTTLSNSLKKQGKYVIFNFSIFSLLAGQTLTIIIPNEFKPKENFTVFAGYNNSAVKVLMMDGVITFTPDIDGFGFDIVNIGWECD